MPPGESLILLPVASAAGQADTVSRDFEPLGARAMATPRTLLSQYRYDPL
ncbi:hypothetical protein PF70_03526, partial [Pseudomonas asplenii]